jgi:diguanylate cyclase (GGDEF)-like protein
VVTGAALAAAERIRTSVANAAIRGRRVTVSVGVSTFPRHGEEVDLLVGSADDALYEAKARGKDRVVLAPFAEKPPDSPDGEAGTPPPS